MIIRTKGRWLSISNFTGSRTWGIQATLVALIAFAFNGQVARAATGTPRMEPPNILYIFTDDHSVRTLGCYSDTPDAYPWVKTPNIDRLAAEGVRFTQSYTGAKCVPSRGTALTGQLQSRYTRETVYWPSKLRQLGYYTGMIGKWHWNVPRHGDAWDWSVVWEHYLPGEGGDEGSDYYFNQSVRINGDKKIPLGGYSSDRYTDYTVEFLKERAQDKEKPWLIWLCFAGVHGPYTPADRHLNDYLSAPAAEIPVDIFGPRPEKPDYLVNFSRWEKNKDGKPLYQDRSFDAWVKQYNQAVRSLDEGVGRIMQALRDTGQLENTIVVFTADQGFAWGQHGFRDKIAPYNSNLLAPLIVSNPGRYPQGAVCEAPVNGADIIRTFYSLTGLQPEPDLDGRDFSVLLKEPLRQDWTDEPMLMTHTGSLYGAEAIGMALKQAHVTGDWTKLIAEKRTGIRSWLMLREGRYKYVRYLYRDYIEELFDLENDPRELENLALRKENHVLLAKLREKLISSFAAKGATFTDQLPPPLIFDSPEAAARRPQPDS
jgi:arylsulfatase A-like enzyme